MGEIHIMFKKIKTLLLSSLVLGGLVGAVQPNQAAVAQEEALEVQFVPTNNDGSSCTTSC